MPSTRTGHFIQIWRPVFEGGNRDLPRFVEVAGRLVSRTTNQYSYDTMEGWSAVSRELPLRRAKRIAKEYARAGFPTRVVLENNNGSTATVLELSPHRKAGK